MPSALCALEGDDPFYLSGLPIQGNHFLAGLHFQLGGKAHKPAILRRSRREGSARKESCQFAVFFKRDDEFKHKAARPLMVLIQLCLQTAERFFIHIQILRTQRGCPPLFFTSAVGAAVAIASVKRIQIRLPAIMLPIIRVTSTPSPRQTQAAVSSSRYLPTSRAMIPRKR